MKTTRQDRWTDEERRPFEVEHLLNGGLRLKVGNHVVRLDAVELIELTEKLARPLISAEIKRLNSGRP